MRRKVSGSKKGQCYLYFSDGEASSRRVSHMNAFCQQIAAVRKIKKFPRHVERTFFGDYIYKTNKKT